MYEAVTSLPIQLPSYFASQFFHLASLQVSNFEPAKRKKAAQDIFMQSPQTTCSAWAPMPAAGPADPVSVVIKLASKKTFTEVGKKEF